MEVRLDSAPLDLLVAAEANGVLGFVHHGTIVVVLVGREGVSELLGSGLLALINYGENVRTRRIGVC